MFSILRINTVTGETRKETDSSKEVLLGGRTLSTRMVSKEVPAQCDPLGRQNKLFFCSGALAGTTASSCHRLSIGSKSPLTGGIKESNAGGVLALRMAQQDLRCIVLEDAPTQDTDWKIIVIGKDKTELVDGGFLEGKGVYEKSDLLTEKFGKRAGCVTIGPAAEKRLLASGLACSDPHGVCSRYAGRGGLGAVLASKRIIAMVVLDDAKVKPEYVDKDSFKQGARKLITLEEVLDTKTCIKIRGYHIDHFDHVNHGRYIEFLEEARWAYMEKNELIPLFHRTGIIHVVTHLSVTYAHSVRANETIEIKTHLEKTGRTSFKMAQTISTKKRLVLEAWVTNVFIDMKTGKPAEPTEELISGWPDLSNRIKKKGEKNG